MLHCHQLRCDRLNLTTIAQEFVSANEVRSNFFLEILDNDFIVR